MTSSGHETKYLIGILAAFSAVGPVATQILLPALPSIQSGFAIDLGTTQLTLSLSLLAMALAQVACGSWSDRVGRLPTAIWGLVIYFAGSVICGLAPNIWILIVGRVIQGAGGAFGIVLSRAIIRDVYGPERSAAVISIVTMAFVVAPMLAPVIGGILTDYTHWRFVFVFTSCVGLLVLALVWWGLKETRQLEEHGDEGTARLRAIDLIRQPLFLSYALQCGFTMGIFFVFIASAPFVVVNILGHTATIYGIGFVIISIGYVIGNLISARISERIGTDAMMLAGTFLAFLSAVLFGGLLIAGYWTLWAIFLPGAMIALSAGLSLPSAQTSAINVAPEAAGVASGITGFLQLAFGAITAQLVGILTTTTPYPMVAGALIMAVLAFLSVLFSRRYSFSQVNRRE
mgnify:FL=1